MDPTNLGKVLEDFYNWFLDASTQITILLLLGVGVVSTFWTIALKPLLLSFSQRYREYVAQTKLDEVRPLLRTLGLLDEGARIRGLKMIRLAETGRPEEVLKSRLIDIMSSFFSESEVLLGRYHSEPNSFFIDLRAAIMTQNNREQLADILTNLIVREVKSDLTKNRYNEIHRVVGLKEGNPIIGMSVADKLQLPLTLYRGNGFPRFHNSKEAIDVFDGIINHGENVILVDDCTFRGTTLIAASQAVSALNGKVVGVFLLFEPGLNTARTSFDRLNIPFCSVVVVDKNMLNRLRKLSKSRSQGKIIP